MDKLSVPFSPKRSRKPDSDKVEGLTVWQPLGWGQDSTFYTKNAVQINPERPSAHRKMMRYGRDSNQDVEVRPIPFH